MITLQAWEWHLFFTWRPKSFFSTILHEKDVPFSLYSHSLLLNEEKVICSFLISSPCLVWKMSEPVKPCLLLLVESKVKPLFIFVWTSHQLVVYYNSFLFLSCTCWSFKCIFFPFFLVFNLCLREVRIALNNMKYVFLIRR